VLPLFCFLYLFVGYDSRRTPADAICFQPLGISGGGGHRDALTTLGVSELALFAAKPDAKNAPDGCKRNGHP
jgi:hypothetical protein